MISKKTISFQFNSTATHLAQLCDFEMRQICISYRVKIGLGCTLIRERNKAQERGTLVCWVGYILFYFPTRKFPQK